MHLQKVQNPPLNALQGGLVVVGLVAAIVVDSLVFRLLAPLLGDTASTLLFWAVGLLIALWTMRRFVMGYSYGMNGSTLRITFSYGRYERLMMDVYLNNVLYTGTLDQMRSRYPNARVRRAIRAKCPIEPLAVAHRDGDSAAILLIQPDETIREALETAARNRKK